MPLFDRYIAVDWSAEAKKKKGPDSIWIADASRGANGIRLAESVNPGTRSETMLIVAARIRESRTRGERMVIGFDFPFGYPAGAAEKLSGSPNWRSLWQGIGALIHDADDNANNRFDVASDLNMRLSAKGYLYWGHPEGRSYDRLRPTRAGLDYSEIAEKRLAERGSTAKPVWQLSGGGNVGGQALTGIARLEALRREFGEVLSVWPFETDFERRLDQPVTLVEIYPTIFTRDERMLPKDRGQVEAVAHGFAELDAKGRLGELLSAPASLGDAERAAIMREEGWIAGMGHDALRRSVSLPRPKHMTRPSAQPYLRDPDAIYARSFATIRAEADLSHLSPALHDVAIRMIHACGMVDLAADIVGSPDIVAAVMQSLGKGGAILCDCEMVRAGIIRRTLPLDTDLIVTLNDPAVPDLAKSLGTTRSAAAVELWRPRLENSIAVIGNAPTALFHLIEMLEAGAPRPAAIIAAPVGFVGAAESKALLVASGFPIPFVTVTGRRGGSAIASAAFNAISKGAWA